MQFCFKYLDYFDCIVLKYEVVRRIPNSLIVEEPDWQRTCVSRKRNNGRCYASKSEALIRSNCNDCPPRCFIDNSTALSSRVGSRQSADIATHLMDVFLLLRLELLHVHITAAGEGSHRRLQSGLSLLLLLQEAGQVVREIFPAGHQVQRHVDGGRLEIFITLFSYLITIQYNTFAVRSKAAEKSEVRGERMLSSWSSFVILSIAGSPDVD